MSSLRPAERALGCLGGALAVPALVPMAALMPLLSPRGERRPPIVRGAALVLVFLLFLVAVLLFLPYQLLLRILGRAGLVRLRMPPSCTVVVRQEGYCRLDAMVPAEERDAAEAMLAAITDRVAAAAGVDGEEARHAVARAVYALEYGRTETLELRFGGAARLTARLYLEQGSLNAEMGVEGNEACVGAAAAVPVERG